MSLTQTRYRRTYTPDSTGLVPTWARPSFTLSGPVTDGVSETVLPTPIVCTVNSSGQLVGPDGQVGVLLYVLDKTSTGAAVMPQGQSYLVDAEPGTPPWSFAPLFADANPTDLATKAP